MQRRDDTPTTRTALALIRRLASQVAHAGSLPLSGNATLRRIAQENTILERIVQLGCITEEHIAATTGIAKGLSKILESLRKSDLLQRKIIGGVTVYWIRPEGLRRVPTIEVPSFGVIDLTVNHKFVTRFCGSDVSLPLSMPHLLGCSELAVKLYLSTNGTILSGRTARLVEKLHNQGKRNEQKRRIIVANGGHIADLAAISPLGEVTVYELELSSHSTTEAEAVCGDLVLSDQIARVVFVADTETLRAEVERRFIAVVEAKPHLADGVQKCIAVGYKGRRLPAISQIMPVGASRSTARRRACRVSSGSGTACWVHA